MSAHVPITHIDFRTNSRQVSPQMVKGVQAATHRFLGNRAKLVSELATWEDLRQAASDLRLHTLNHLDYYLEQLESHVVAAGGHVHWARNAADARDTIVKIVRDHGAKTVVKGKSMATEEIGLNHALEAARIHALETDLGEYIVQLAGTPPSHIIAPALHLTKEGIAALFNEKLGANLPADPVRLTAFAHEKLRQEFLSADVGISGANFMVAETGTIVLVTNEGNGRMVTTQPPVHIAVAGIDKVIPDWESLAVLLKVLARSATGQKVSTYTSFITGPRQSDAENGPHEFHLVLLDNGRTKILRDPATRETLKCIRCGACLNICPVYNNVGGHAYGWVYSGPIGAILSPQLLGTEIAADLPYASTLCGACVEICPVKIPITNILLHMRHRVVEGDAVEAPIAPGIARIAASLTLFGMGTPWAFRLGAFLARIAQAPFRRDGWLQKLPPPLDRWTMVRPLPAFKSGFREWWVKRGRSSEERDAKRG